MQVSTEQIFNATAATARPSSGSGLSRVVTFVLGGSSHLVSGLVHPSYKWINPLLIPCQSLGLQPTYNSWDEPPFVTMFFFKLPFLWGRQ